MSSHANLLIIVSKLRTLLQSAHSAGMSVAPLLKWLCGYFDARYSMYIDYRTDSTSIQHAADARVSQSDLEHIVALVTNEHALTAQMKTYEQPRIINNFADSDEFPALAALSRYHAHHLLIMPLVRQRRVYAAILMLRYDNQGVFLERERECALGTALYLGIWWEDSGTPHRGIDPLHSEEHYKSHGLKDAIRDYRRNHITSVLAHHHGNQTYAAQELGIQRTYLNKLLRAWYKQDRK